MSDAERSIESCLIAFAEFQERLQRCLKHSQSSTIRLAVQVAKGRVMNTQVALNTDFRPEKATKANILKDDELQLAMLAATRIFQQWHEDDLTNALEKRQNGWVRLAITVDAGAVQNANLNPSFDIKPT